jgi:deazaflavin-dependent oxidoreductase (nitroreductase family)
VKRWTRTLLRLPVLIDRAGLGRFLGHRFIIVEHEGRRTGRVHRTPLEVIAHDRNNDELMVIAAWRRRPDWLVNIEARPARAVRVAGRRHVQPRQRLLTPDERLDVLAAYGVAHPRALRLLFRAFRWGDPRTPGVLRQLAADHVIVAFASEPPAPTGPSWRVLRSARAW